MLNPAQERLFFKHIPFATKVANRFIAGMPVGARSMHEDDIHAESQIGLLDAAKRYDKGRDVKFATYAYGRIGGAIKSYLRRQDDFTRSERALINRFKSSFDVQEGIDKFRVTPKEARDNGFSEPEYEKIQSLLNRVVFSTSHLKNGHDFSADTIRRWCPEDDIIGIIFRKEVAFYLRLIVRALPEKQKKVVTLYSYGFTMKTIGKYLSITESRVSQLYSEATKKIKRKLELIIFDAFSA